MVSVAELFSQRDHVFLGFDGPVCELYGGLSARSVAERLKVFVGPPLPAEVAASGDPFEVLAYAAECGPNTADVVERHLRGLELEAVAVAPATPGADELIRALARAGSTVTIVSNCSVSAVRAYLVVHDLAESARRISDRTGPDLARLLPGPFFVERAVEALGAFPRQCVMVCDSAAAIDAARAPTTPMPLSSTSPTCV